MQYDSIILELMNRIKVLESRCDEMSQQIAALSAQQADAAEGLFAEPDSAPRQSMTPERIRACYECAVALSQHDHLDFGTEIDKLLAGTHMNRNSAIMYVYAVKNMLNGEVYKRAISHSATRLFFQYIAEDFGEEKLKDAIRATRAHIEYRQQCGQVVNGLIDLCDQYE